MAENFAIVEWQDGSVERPDTEHPAPMPHIASALVDEQVYSSTELLEAAISRAFQICLQLGIPISTHFRHIHVFSGDGETAVDWALSDLAFYLLLLNGDAANERVACAQGWAIRKTLA